MKKQKIELSRKLFMKKDTISSLDDRQSDKVAGGGASAPWSANPPVHDPNCMYCFPTAEDCVTQRISCNVNNCSIITGNPNC